MRLTLVTLLYMLFSLACRPMTQAPKTAPDQVADMNQSLQLEIHPGVAASPGGMRIPLRFTIHNKADEPVHACLSGSRVIHLWELDRDYGYTLSQQRVDLPSCEEQFDLPARGTYSWTEEVTLPPAPGAARLVGLTQVVPAEPCTSDCEPVWLTASAPFEIQKQELGQGTTVDLRTGLLSTGLATPIDANGPGIER